MHKTRICNSTGSTNRDAVALAGDGATHGTAIVADTQTMGRGRLGKSWNSPSGKGLYCSIIVRPRISPQNYPHLTFVAGLAVVDVIKRLYQLEAGLKWPNDIYFGMRKCGGILTESSSLNGPEQDRFAVVGIGLNINTTREDFPPELHDLATSLVIESGRILSIRQVFDEIRLELLEQVSQFEQHGFGKVIARWRKRDFMRGKRLTWVSVSGEKVDGISLGPDNDGRLHVIDEKNVVHEVLSGDIQLVLR